jgi:glycosyltransferase involved in cell wall biosynthesis
MANARATIATSVGGVVDLLGEAIGGPIKATTDDGRSGVKLCERGVLVQPNDAGAFCRGLSRLLEDEELRLQLGTRGQRFVTQNYSRERLLRDISGLYREMSEQGTLKMAKVQGPKSKVKSHRTDFGV